MFLNFRLKKKRKMNEVACEKCKNKFDYDKFRRIIIRPCLHVCCWQCLKQSIEQKCPKCECPFEHNYPEISAQSLNEKVIYLVHF